MLSTRTKLTSSIEKGTNCLYSFINSDNGLLYHNENSPCSGIWVTAESLEFLISSQNITREGMEFNRIISMVKFVVDSQNEDGSWSILMEKHRENHPSSISTGHCIYALKLALARNYFSIDNPFEKIYEAIIHGEEWLLNNYRENEEGIYWKTGIKKPDEELKNNTDGLRIEYVFTTFYAMLGFVNPSNYIDNLKLNNSNAWIKETDDENPKNKVVPKVADFLESQAVYFYNSYRGKKLDSNVFSQISSTISRICGGLIYLNRRISSEIKNGLKKILLSNIHDAYYTSALKVHGDNVQDNTSTYNNNTPFDIAVALFNLDVEYSYIKPLINRFLEEQQEDGYWYLNFTHIPSEIKVWSTTEALMVIERALNYKKNTPLIKKVGNYFKYISRKKLAFSLIGIILTILLMVVLISINYNAAIQLSIWEVLKNTIGFVLIPLGCGILSDIIKKYII